MNNTEIASVFRDIASLLEKKKDSWFKVRSYRKVADEIESLPIALSSFAAEGKLREIPGVGEAIEKKITEMLTTGKLQFYEKLKVEVGDTIHGKPQSDETSSGLTRFDSEVILRLREAITAGNLLPF